MREHIRAAQRLWFLVVALSGLLTAIAIYGMGDAAIHAAVEELTAFESRFDSDAVSASLSETARAQGVLPLQELAKHITGPGVPDTSAAGGQVAPMGLVKVQTIDQALALSAGGTVELTRVDPALLGKALAFRLARAGIAESVVLTRVALSGTGVTPDDAAKLIVAESRRKRSLRSRRELNAATAVRDRLIELYKLRVKWKAHRRVLRKTREKLAKAKAARNEAHATWKTDFDAYQSAAELALALPANSQTPGRANMALVTATFARANGRELELAVPVSLSAMTATLPPLTGVAFPATKTAELWNTLKDLSPGAAVLRAQESFGPVSKPLTVFGISTTTATALQFLPFVLPILLGLLLQRCRRTAASYNPFSNAGQLPSLGLGSSAIDVGTLVAVPTLAGAACALCLFKLGHVPFGASAAALASFGIGIWAFRSVVELRDLLAAIVRQSQPPRPLSQD